MLGTILSSWFGSFNLFLKRKERYATSTAFVLGFIWDNLTLTRVDLFYDNLVLAIYLTIACFGIVTFQVFDTSHSQGVFAEKVKRFVPLFIQFAFGGLFSAYIIYYSKSATFVESWPFIIFLIVLVIGNEIFKNRYSKLTFQLSILFVTVFSYTIFSLPVFLGEIGSRVFLLSGVLSLLFIFLIYILLYRINKTQIIKSKKGLIISIFSVYVFFNIAYFTNIIPPIPLSPKEINVYHSVLRLENGSYAVTYEPAPKYLFYKKVSSVFHHYQNKPVYVFSSVFAPTKIKITVFHEWSYYDDSEKKWVKDIRVPFTLSGGRDDGYRGYSVKSNLKQGKWRVDVLTERGQLIERLNFLVVKSESKPTLKKDIR